MLDCLGISYDLLMVSEDAHLILPWHIEIDKQKNKSLSNGGIGSTGRGIGPCYEDKVARRGVMVRDLYNPDILAKKLQAIKSHYETLSPQFTMSIDDAMVQLAPHAERIKPFVANTIYHMQQFYRQGRKILLEGAQGVLLSIEYGTYPYVTSSDCSLNGTASGVGLSANLVDLPLGLVKFPVMTRVGGGPFPTEFGGVEGEKYCQGVEGERYRSDPNLFKKEELENLGIPFEENDGKVHYDTKHPNVIRLINDRDPIQKARGLRLIANEFGATTGRPRRMGWVDAVAARYAIGINGPYVVLTKVDAFSGMDCFSIAKGYKIGESPVQFDRNADRLATVTPTYATYNGYDKIEGVQRFKDLPDSLRVAIHDFQEFTGGNVVAISTGPKSHQMMLKDQR